MTCMDGRASEELSGGRGRNKPVCPLLKLVVVDGRVQSAAWAFTSPAPVASILKLTFKARDTSIVASNSSSSSIFIVCIGI